MLDELKRIKSLKKEDIYFSRIMNAILRRIYYLPQKFIYYMPVGFYRRNRNNLKSFNNIHKGERCFVIANGPSLKDVDFSLLENEFTIGMNRIYLMKEQNGFTPSYLACIDEKSQINQFHEEFDKVEIPCFFNFKLRNKFSKLSNQNFILGKFSQSFATGISKTYGNGKSVTYTAIQLAYYMGFKEVYIIGKDHSYNTDQKAGTGIKSDGNEDNHFIKGYYKKGQNWDAPDLTGEELAYKIARNKFEINGRIIKDATHRGKLEIFEKIKFESIFDK
jgi:uncharacterized Rossmann fold enzyme